jgi:hypothetical protein
MSGMGREARAAGIMRDTMRRGAGADRDRLTAGRTASYAEFFRLLWPYFWPKEKRNRLSAVSW